MSIKKRWGHTILTSTYYWLSERLHGREGVVRCGLRSDGDCDQRGPLCQLQTSCDPCATSLFPGRCCSSVFPPYLETCCISISSPHPCPSFLAQLVSDSLLWFVSPALTSSLNNLFLCRFEFAIISPYLSFSQSLLPCTTPSSQTLHSPLAFTLFSAFLTLCSLSSLWVYLDQLLYLGHNSY